MKIWTRLHSSLAVGVVLLLGLLQASAEPLFNGKDLSGWDIDVPQSEGNPDIQPSFIVRDGKLVTLGNPAGHIITKKSFENYRLTLDYRFSVKAGDCGLLIHCSKLRALSSIYPQSIEIQIQPGRTGDFWCNMENIEVIDMEKRRSRKKGQKFGGGKNDARHISKLTHQPEKSLGEWNTMVVECKDKEVKVWINEVLVNHGTKATTNQGKIAIQADGTEVEFRKIEVEPVSDK